VALTVITRLKVVKAGENFTASMSQRGGAVVWITKSARQKGGASNQLPGSLTPSIDAADILGGPQAYGHTYEPAFTALHYTFTHTQQPGAG
jgi:hypothetical protein